MEKEDRIREMLSYIDTNNLSLNGKPRRRPGSYSDLVRQISLYYEDHTPIDIHKDRISANTIVAEVIELLKESAVKQDSIEHFVGEMENYISTVKGWNSQDRGEPYDTYTVFFPLLVSRDRVLPDELESRDYTIHRVNHDEWLDYLKTVKKECSWYTRYEHDQPNSLESDGFSYWKIQCEANDPSYATLIASLVIDLFLSKVNFINLYKQATEREQPHHPFGSNLRTPFSFIVFQQEEYKELISTDLEKRLLAKVHWDRYEIYEAVQDLPTFPWNYRIDNSELDDLIVQALYEYQYAITATDLTQAFAGFWRSIEVLTTHNHNEDTGTVSKRAEFVYTSQSNRFEDGFNGSLGGKRNTLVHEGHLSSNINQFDYLDAKYLLDQLLDFYLYNYSQLGSAWDVKEYIRLGAKQPDLRADLDRLRELDMQMNK